MIYLHNVSPERWACQKIKNLFFVCVSNVFFIRIFVSVHIVVLLILFTILNCLSSYNKSYFYPYDMGLESDLEVYCK